MSKPSETIPIDASEKTMRTVVALSIAQLVSWGAIFYSFSLFIVPMEHELGWSRTAMNAALSLGLLVSGLCAYPIGRWIDRYGGRTVMTTGSVLASVLLVWWAFAGTLPELFVIWIGLGMAMGATLYDPVFAVITRSNPKSYRTKIIILTLVGGFASTVFIPLTQYLISHLGWRHALLALAGINAVLCIPIHLFILRDRHSVIADEEHKNDVVNKMAAERALRHPTFWALLICFTTYYANFAVMTFHLVPLFIERGVKIGIIVVAMALIGPAQVAGRIILLIIGRRLNTVVVGRIVLTIFSVSILLLIYFPASTTMLFLFVLLYGGANGMITIIRGTAVPDLLWKEGYGRINGLIAFPSNVAKAAGPICAALLWSAFGNYNAVLWGVFLVSVITAASFWTATTIKKININ